jgi:hypothetical protein
MDLAPVMPAVSARRKYDLSSGVVVVTPLRMTNQSNSRDPARSMRATKLKPGPAKLLES